MTTPIPGGYAHLEGRRPSSDRSVRFKRVQPPDTGAFVSPNRWNRHRGELVPAAEPLHLNMGMNRIGIDVCRAGSLRRHVPSGDGAGSL